MTSTIERLSDVLPAPQHDPTLFKWKDPVTLFSAFMGNNKIRCIMFGAGLGDSVWNEIHHMLMMNGDRCLKLYNEFQSLYGGGRCDFNELIRRAEILYKQDCADLARKASKPFIYTQPMPTVEVVQSQTVQRSDVLPDPGDVAAYKLQRIDRLGTVSLTVHLLHHDATRAAWNGIDRYPEAFNQFWTDVHYVLITNGPELLRRVNAVENTALTMSELVRRIDTAYQSDLERLK